MTSRTYAFFVFCSALYGCDNREFVGPDDLYEFALTEDTPPFIETEDATLYLIETRVELPIREPSAEQLANLQAGSAMSAPFARMPWVRRGDYEIEMDWTLSNLSNDTVRVDVVVNGFNEFFEYLPGVTLDDDNIIPDYAEWESFLELGPMERKHGTVREEEFDEAAVDLATVVNGAPNSNQIVFPDSESALDPRSKLYIPSVIPALTGFRIGLRATAATNIVLEASVRVRDVHNRIVKQRDAWELPVPVPFVPVAPMEEM